MGTIANLIEIKPLHGYKLRLHYDDGVEGEVDLSRFVGKGVFVPWNDYPRFEQVSIGPHGEPVWGDDIDLCPDALYLEITGKRPEEASRPCKPNAVET